MADLYCGKQMFHSIKSFFLPLFLFPNILFVTATILPGQGSCTSLGVIAFYSSLTEPYETPSITSVCITPTFQLSYLFSESQGFLTLLTELCSCYSAVGLSSPTFSVVYNFGIPSFEGFAMCTDGQAILTEIMFNNSSSSIQVLCLSTMSFSVTTTQISLSTLTYLDISTLTITNLILSTTTTTTSFSETQTVFSTTSTTISTTSTATLTVEFDFTSTRTLDSRTRVPVTQTDTLTTNLAQTDTISITSTVRTSVTTTRTKTITSVDTFYSLSCPRQSTFTISTSTTVSSTTTVSRCSTRTRKTTTTVILEDLSVTKTLFSTRTLVSVETTSTTTITTISNACGSEFDAADFKVCNLKNGMILVEAQVAHGNAACVCRRFSRQLASVPESNSIYALKSLMSVDIYAACKVSRAWIQSDKCKAIVKLDDGNAILPHNCESHLPVLCGV